MSKTIHLPPEFTAVLLSRGVTRRIQTQHKEDTRNSPDFVQGMCVHLEITPEGTQVCLEPTVNDDGTPNGWLCKRHSVEILGRRVQLPPERKTQEERDLEHVESIVLCDAREIARTREVSPVVH